VITVILVALYHHFNHSWLHQNILPYLMLSNVLADVLCESQKDGPLTSSITEDIEVGMLPSRLVYWDVTNTALHGSVEIKTFDRQSDTCMACIETHSQLSYC